MKDPIDVPIEKKVALLFATNEAALKVREDPIRERQACSSCAK